MSRRFRSASQILVVLGAIGALCAGIAWAQQAAPKYPIMEQIALKVIQKYQTTSCADLAAAKQKPPSAEELATMQKVGMALRADPQMRTEFLNRVAPTIANKMFECGMIP